MTTYSGTDSYIQDQRMHIRVPRSVLLPPYLSNNPYFTQYTDAIDAVLGPIVDEHTRIFENLRNMWVSSPEVETVIQSNQLIDNATWPIQERNTLVSQSNMLGMKLSNAGILSDEAYQTLTRFVGQYWFEKGTGAFIDFINFCMGTNFTLINLWTQDYISFLPEADIGLTIYEGGTWYPTTHVQISALGGLGGLDLSTLISFFYEVANYNLVLFSVDSTFNMPIVDSVSYKNGSSDAVVVAIGMYAENSMVISNVYQYGAYPPPLLPITDSIPTTYYAIDSASPDSYLLGAPSSWMDIAGGFRVPVYTATDQVVTTNDSITTQLMGNTGEQQLLLYGPVDWIPIPGSTRSTARIPVYSTSAFTVGSSNTLSTSQIGQNRGALLTNPTGFTEVSPGNFAPYWA